MEVPVRFIRGRILIPLLLVLVGSLHSAGGAPRIDECNDGWMEIEENRGTEVSFTCQGLSSSESVTWYLANNSRLQGIFTCGPDQQCNSTDPDILVSRPSAKVSVLTITSGYRVGLGSTTVTCSSPSGSAECIITVNGSPVAPVTNCPQYVYENVVLRCDCLVNASSPGSHRPIVQWKGSDPGQRLLTNTVTRNNTGQVFTCTQMWGSDSDREYLETNYTLDVAYGPDAVNITRLDGMQTTNPNHFTLQCTATGVYPAANFLWSGVTCNSSLPFYLTNLTDGSICRFMATAEDDGKVVTCTTANSPLPGKSKNATYQVLVTYNKATTTTLQTNEVVTGGGRPVPYIAGGAGGAGGAVVIIVVVVVVIIACRRRRRRRQRKDAGRAQEIPGSPQNAALESDDYENAEAVSGIAAPAQGRGDYYSSLQMSNVGLRSDYSELGCQHDTA